MLYVDSTHSSAICLSSPTPNTPTTFPLSAQMARLNPFASSSQNRRIPRPAKTPRAHRWQPQTTSLRDIHLQQQPYSFPRSQALTRPPSSTPRAFHTGIPQCIPEAAIQVIGTAPCLSFRRGWYRAAQIRRLVVFLPLLCRGVLSYSDPPWLRSPVSRGLAVCVRTP